MLGISFSSSKTCVDVVKSVFLKTVVIEMLIGGKFAALQDPFYGALTGLFISFFSIDLCVAFFAQDSNWSISGLSLVK